MTIRHLTLDELEAGLAQIRQSPQDGGVLIEDVITRLIWCIHKLLRLHPRQACGHLGQQRLEWPSQVCLAIRITVVIRHQQHLAAPEAARRSQCAHRLGDHDLRLGQRTRWNTPNRQFGQWLGQWIT